MRGTRDVETEAGCGDGPYIAAKLIPQPAGPEKTSFDQISGQWLT